MSKVDKSSKRTCGFFLERKRRYCRLHAGEGQKFCGEHITNSSEKIRIKCPLDPSHTCFKANLKNHLKKCNATKNLPTDKWYQPNINSTALLEENAYLNKSIKDFMDDGLVNVIENIKTIELPEIEIDNEVLPSMQSKISQLNGCVSALKHVEQIASLLNILFKSDFSEKSCFIEFGAGRGQLTETIIDSSLQNSTNHEYLLIDRGSNRRKRDAKYRKEGVIKVNRIRVDIKDLNLGKTKEFSENEIVVISKHLCGSATDLTLNCLQRTINTRHINCGIIALCCHHRCSWSDYCGKSYLKKINIGIKEFHMLIKMSSWAVCNFRSSIQQNTDEALINLSDNEKEYIGNKCKRILDQGRVEFLQEMGLTAKLVQYTTKEISLENICLVFNKVITKL